MGWRAPGPDRTGDLVLTRDALCLLSYKGVGDRGIGVSGAWLPGKDSNLD